MSVHALAALLVACRPEPGPVDPPTEPDTAPSETGTSAEPYPDDVLAFVGVDVLTMRPDEPVLHDRTVVVHGDRILDVALAEVALPDGATRIDGAGRTLMPGLIDAHVHVWFEGELTLLLANGVTTARNLFGDPLQRGWRDEIEAGTRLGPRLVVSGPIVDGIPPLWPGSDVITDPAEAEALVAAQVAAGYDLVKVYNRLSPEVYDAVVVAAAAQGMPVGGHVPWRVGWDPVVATGQVTIEHFDGLVDHVGGTDGGTFLYDAVAMNAAMDARDDERLRAAAEAAAADGVVQVPTLIVVERIGDLEAGAAAAADWLPYVHPYMRASWESSPPVSLPAAEMLARYAAETRSYAAAFHDAGAALALGTDANNPYVVPGPSVHEELVRLVQAGLTPMEALMAGTVTAARALGLDDTGTIAVGQRADLLLLTRDPSEDVSAAADRVGVVVAGRWIPQEELQGLLDELAASYAQLRSGPAPHVRTCRH